MTTVRQRGEKVRSFIIEHVERAPAEIATVVSKKFAISRQAANKHLKKLVEEGALVATGTTRARTYKLKALVTWRESFVRSPELAEDVVWRENIAPRLDHLPDNVMDIWRYGFTEMFNNAISHSDGTTIVVHLTRTAASTEILILDNGVGIFRKIQKALSLLDERQAVLELAKGKITTDPKNHTGEGIFFSSRMFDRFLIISDETIFSHDFGEKEDWIMEISKRDSGTRVLMILNNHTSRTAKKVFDSFTAEDDYGFSKTVVPVRMAQYGEDLLISRSQAKRLLTRVDRFKIVVFDFSGVTAIGHAFADEIFRVFQNQHPDLEIHDVNANKDIKNMIERARHVS